MERVRRAPHAGSWYTDNAKKLDEDPGRWLLATGLTKSSNVRGVIAPFAFAKIDPSSIERVFLLGSSYHYYTPRCALTRTTIIILPWEIYQLIWKVPFAVNEVLKATGKFELMDLHVDEAEHIMEMHLPYLAKVFHGILSKLCQFWLVLLVQRTKQSTGNCLLGMWMILRFSFLSSDSCHWGSRFSYTYYDKKQGPIYKSIEALDHMGMDIIETRDADAFKNYLMQYGNTICGRHPISVFLHVSPGSQRETLRKMLKNCWTKIKIGFSAIRAIEPLQKHARQ